MNETNEINEINETMRLKIGIIGATGLVGQTLFRVLEERNISISKIFPYSFKPKGKSIIFKGMKIPVKKMGEIPEVDVAFFSAGEEISLKFAPEFVKNGALVIDNSTAFRMDKSVPLVIPEINPEDASKNSGIIANPNCSTIIALMSVYPIWKKYGVKRMLASTYQSVSGAGRDALKDLNKQKPDYFPVQIKENLIPLIGKMTDSGYTEEEVKMEKETRKILSDNKIMVSATCVRVPVRISHSISVTLELKSPFDIQKIIELLKSSKGVKVSEPFITPREVAGKDTVYVSRIRRCSTFKNGLSMWVVGDNLRKGAATNAVQILETIIGK